ncbi:MAG: DUF1579 family protein [Phycisphaerae bacterium]
MNRVRTGLATAVLLAAVGIVSFAQDHAATSAPARQGSEKAGAQSAEESRYAEIAKAFADAAATGPRHADLERYLGEWDVAFVYKMVPGRTTEEKGTATFRWLIEGRWLIEELDANFSGRPFKGFNLIGYDNLKKQYVGCWVDSMSTSMILASGAMDPSNSLLTTYSELDDLARNMRGKIMQSTTRFVDEKTMIYTTSDVLWGETRTMFEATYTRKK